MNITVLWHAVHHLSGFYLEANILLRSKALVFGDDCLVIFMIRLFISQKSQHEWKDQKKAFRWLLMGIFKINYINRIPESFPRYHLSKTFRTLCASLVTWGVSRTTLYCQVKKNSNTLYWLSNPGSAPNYFSLSSKKFSNVLC